MLQKLDHARPIHFVGIGGSSMSGLALMLHQLGYLVTGSDLSNGQNVKGLRDAGISAATGHHADNLPDDAQLVVITSASIRPDNPELRAAHAANIPVIDRAELLGKLMTRHGRSIGVAGTRGKTTTTAAVAHVLEAAGLDPAVSIGTAVTNDGGNYRIGSGDYFVAEACEYHRAFLHLAPYAAVVLNIEADHGDYFTGPADVQDAFQSYVDHVLPGGVAVVSADSPSTQSLTVADDVRRVTVGFSHDADYHVQSLAWANGLPTFTVTHSDATTTIRAGIAGRHNIFNLAAAFAVTSELGLPTEVTVPAIETFHGAPRRLQHRGTAAGIQVYDDLACTPGEITATMTALRGLAAGAKVTVVLRPNSYTRVRDYLADYAAAFTDAEQIILTGIYQGRDTDTYGMTPSDLVREFTRLNRPIRHIPDRDGRPDTPVIINDLNQSLSSGDVLITIGPLDIAHLGAQWIAQQTADTPLSA